MELFGIYKNIIYLNNDNIQNVKYIREYNMDEKLLQRWVIKQVQEAVPLGVCSKIQLYLEQSFCY